MKRIKTKRMANLSLACTEQDKVAAERVRKLAGPFPPSTSLLLLLLIRHGVASVLKGEISLQALSARYAHINLESIAAQSTTAGQR